MTEPNHDSVSFLSETIDLTQGLTPDQVKRFRSKFGKNLLSPPPRTPWWRQLLEKFQDPTIIILLASAIISVTMTAIEIHALGNTEVSYTESIGIFLAVFLAIAVGFISERKSEGEFEALNKVKDDIPVKVLRNGQITEISIADVVVGDVVRLDLGDKIPADGVILQSMGLLVDQSLLTGESAPVEKAAFALPAKLDESTEIPESGMASRGTMVNDGHGYMLVEKVGDATEMGKIASNLVEDESKAVTPLTGKLSRLAKQISILGVTGAMAIFTCMAITTILDSPLTNKFLESNYEIGMGIASIILGLILMRSALRPFFASMDMELNNPFLQLIAAVPVSVMCFAVGMSSWGFYGEWDVQAMTLLQSVLTAFVVAVTIIVVAVPEGLPMMVTVSLAMNMMKMARQNCLVRKLVASETIGCATVICSDKTGTLTQNKMQPVWFWANGREYKQSEIPELVKQPLWSVLATSVAVNSEANLETDGTTIHRIGNPTECALLALFYEKGFDYRSIRDNAVRLHEMSHNSQRKMSMVLVENDDKTVCHIKGAPERILLKCSFISQNGQSADIVPFRAEIDKALAAASARALRVLAIAAKTTCSNEDCDPEACLQCPNYVLLALVGIEDPVRAEVPNAVKTCQTAGVQVKMITGDARPTAIAIAKGCGILPEDYLSDANDNTVLTSEELGQVSDADLPEVAGKLRVLARSTPMDKLRLVKALHHTGAVVAMTGDGTNDAPALKFADVGLSMGISGTEVAKEASDIVLVDDNFKSIVTGIWWGRTLYQNIQRFLQFQLSVNFVALSCALLGPLIGISLPLTVTQLLWINIIMDTFAAIAYSTDPPRPQSMSRKPVPRNAHIIMPSMWVSILLNSAYQVAILFSALYFGWFLESGEKPFAWHSNLTDPSVVKENLAALTIFFTIFISFQFWHKFNCRALFHDESPFTLLHKNKLFLLIIGLITVSQVVMVQMSETVPAIGQIFRTTPLTLAQWGKILALTLTIIPFAWFSHQIAFWFGTEKE